jgi:hypothetical protein
MPNPHAKARTSPRFPEGYHDVTLRVPPETRQGLNDMAAAYCFKDRNEFVTFLVQTWRDGCVAIMDKNTKELLVGAAEEKVLTQAKRVARQETWFTLYEEGFRSTPYDR